MSPDWVLNVANILVLASFSVRDILWLRVLSVTGSGFFIGFFALTDTTAGIVWNTAFALLNGYHIARLVHERRPVALTADEVRLHSAVFPSLTSRELSRLARAGTWQDLSPGESICEQGQALGHLVVLHTGVAAVEVGEERVAELRPGAFIGEMSFLTGAATSATVRAVESVRTISWPAAELRAFLDRHEAVKTALQQTLGHDLARKLRRDAMSAVDSAV